MLLNKHSLDIPTRFAGDNDASYMLNGVHVTPDHIVATNGHMLCVLEHQKDLKDSEFPACGQSEPVEVGPMQPFQPCTVDKDQWAKIGKALPKKTRHSLPILSRALLDEVKSSVNGSVSVRVTDLENPQEFILKKMEGNYPRYAQVIPQGEPEYSIALNPRYLERIGKAFADFLGASKHGSNPVVMRMHGPLAPVDFKAKNTDTGQELQIILMPVRAEGAKGMNKSMVVEQWAKNVNREHADFWEQF